MPSSAKSSARAKKIDDEFVLFLQGIPTHCRWQELKDLVRQTAQQIRQAIVYDDPHGFPTGLGQIIVKQEEAAWHKLSTNGWDGQSLTVTLARTSSPTHPIAGPTKSPSCTPTGYPTGYSTPPMSPEPSYSPEYSMSSVAMLPLPPSRPFFAPAFAGPLPLSVIPTLSGMQAPLHRPHLYTLEPIPGSANVYASTNRPYNYPNKLLPACSSIFVQNLSSLTGEADVTDHFSPSGTIARCDIFTDRSTGLCRGFARVVFHTNEEARHAVAMGDNSFLLGARIRVRFDRYPYLRSGRIHRTGGWPAAGDTKHKHIPATATVTGYGSWMSAVPSSTIVPVPGPRITVDRSLLQPLVVNGSGAGFRGRERAVTKGPV